MIDSFDAGGKLLLWNRACEEQLGYLRAEIEAVTDPLAFFYPVAEYRERAKLISSSKLAALGEMAGGIAHEINNPLAVISGLADQLLTLEEEQGKSDLKLEMLRDLKASVARISKIIKGMRCLSRDASRDPKRREEI